MKITETQMGMSEDLAILLEAWRRVGYSAGDAFTTLMRACLVFKVINGAAGDALWQRIMAEEESLSTTANAMREEGTLPAPPPDPNAN